MKTLRFHFIVLIFVIVIQLAMPYPALADDTPPPTGTEETSPAQPDGSTTDGTGDSASYPVPTDEATLPPAGTEEGPSAQPDASTADMTIDSAPDISPAVDPALVVEPLVEESTAAEIMQDIPADTGIVVLDETGQPVSLATQEAADILVNSDPMWCPASATVTTDCVNATTVTALLPSLATKNEDGIIYFYTPTAYNNNDVIFDGANANLLQLANNSLTLQGGWDGNSGAIVLSGNSNFSVPISIINWTGAVSVQNINIDHANGDGLTIETTGPVSITNVDTTYNTGDGINIQTNADVSLNNVHSNHNTGNGLTIAATPVLASVTYNETFIPGPTTYLVAGYGPIDVETGALIVTRNVDFQHISITGSEFNQNGGNGLTINTAGSMTLSNVTANGNIKNGAVIDHFVNTPPPFPWAYFQNRPYPQPYDLYAFEPVHYIASSATSIWFNDNGEYGMIEQGQLPAADGSPFLGAHIDNYTFMWYFLNTIELSGNEQGTDYQLTSPQLQPPPTGLIPILGGEDMDLGGTDAADSKSLNSNKPLCEQMSIFALQLPNGDSVVVYCPISGTITVESLGRKALPSALPDGYDYLSALEVKLTQNNVPLQVIENAGHLGVSFVVPADQAGKNLTILFWDPSVNKWVELPVFGSEVSASLQNGGTVLKGVQWLNNIGQMQVDVNFPGLFVLAVR